MSNVNTKLMLKTVLFTPGPRGAWGLPVLGIGEPGAAKSSIMERTAEESGLHCETVVASLREPADFLGIPWVEGGKLTYKAPPWAVRLNELEGGVVFFDELNTAPVSVQKALLRVFFERWAGDTKLHKRVRILAAMNPPEMAADGHDISMPMANRLIHWRWEAPAVSEWIDWVISGGADEEVTGGDAKSLEDSVMKVWPNHYARAAGLVTGFATKRPELMRKTPKAEDPGASGAWASYRTWEMAIRILAGAETHGLGETETQLLMSGAVGEGPTTEFLTYCENADLPNFEHILDGKAKWEPDDRLDRTLAVFQGCATLVCPTGAVKREERATGLWKILQHSVEKQADLVFPASKALCKAKLSKSKEASNVLYKLEPVYRAAGMIPG